jgi:hypothetical protein
MAQCVKRCFCACVENTAISLISFILNIPSKCGGSTCDIKDSHLRTHRRKNFQSYSVHFYITDQQLRFTLPSYVCMIQIKTENRFVTGCDTLPRKVKAVHNLDVSAQWLCSNTNLALVTQSYFCTRRQRDEQLLPFRQYLKFVYPFKAQCVLYVPPVSTISNPAFIPP